MGSQTILDLIASTIVFGTLLVIGIRLNSNSSENMQKIRSDVTVQQNLVALVSTLEYDLRKLGYSTSPDSLDSREAILKADTSEIKFLTDYDRDGDIDQIWYKLGETTGADAPEWTPNPRDRYLFRTINDETEQKVYLGVTVFRLRYFNTQKDTLFPPFDGIKGTSNPTSEIYTIEISVMCESWVATQVDSSQFGLGATGDKEVYQTAYWRQIRLAAKNLRNR